jgi:hypothetical protein
MSDDQLKIGPTCQFTKRNGEFCKRGIAEGETYCWQHARSLRHRWKSLTRNQGVGFAIATVALLSGLVFGGLEIYWHYNLEPLRFSAGKDNAAPPKSTNPTDLSSTKPTPELKKLRSFVLVAPGPIVNNDAWDFIVNLKGPEPVDSIEVMFRDSDKLEHLQKTSSIALPNEYSVFLRIDRMYPKGKGSLFAKQFIWKPFSLEHGHYTVEVSASSGRFHQELYIENVSGEWKYASKVADIDTGDTMFICRDKNFPHSVGSKIVSNHACWPEIAAF